MALAELLGFLILKKSMKKSVVEPPFWKQKNTRLSWFEILRVVVNTIGSIRFKKFAKGFNEFFSGSFHEVRYLYCLSQNIKIFQNKLYFGLKSKNLGFFKCPFSQNFTFARSPPTTYPANS